MCGDARMRGSPTDRRSRGGRLASESPGEHSLTYPGPRCTHAPFRVVNRPRAAEVWGRWAGYGAELGGWAGRAGGRSLAGPWPVTGRRDASMNLSGTPVRRLPRGPDPPGGVLSFPLRRGAIAQLGERLNGIQKVRGSSPLSSTTSSPVTTDQVTTPRRRRGVFRACVADRDVTSPARTPPIRTTLPRIIDSHPTMTVGRVSARPGLGTRRHGFRWFPPPPDAN
jgi:hypothetical protein